MRVKEAWEREGGGTRKKKNGRMSKGEEHPQAPPHLLFIGGMEPNQPENVAQEKQSTIEAL
jgi:hypothetical protein